MDLETLIGAEPAQRALDAGPEHRRKLAEDCVGIILDAIQAEDRKPAKISSKQRPARDGPQSFTLAHLVPR